MATVSEPTKRKRRDLPPTAWRSSDQAAYSRRQNAEQAEIGKLPDVQNPRRRSVCQWDLLLFLQSYFPESTGQSPFSPDHLHVIANTETAILRGGWFAQAVYRGFSKTTIGENSVIWSIVYGHARYVPIFAGERSLANEIQRSIMLEFETNERLADDFPEVCHAIHHVEGKPQRAHSQTFQGERTHIKWNADQCIFPVIPGSSASGAMIRSRGILGASRGLKAKNAFGQNVRPSFIIIDDFQTDESAAQPGQVEKRLNIIKKSILKSGGHRNKVSCLINGTIIEKDDGMDQLTNPEVSPAFDSCRIPMVRKWSDVHEDMWLGKYADIRNAFNPEMPGDKLRARTESTAFYRENREEMDAGCVVSWKSCYDPEWELSAIQHAYNELIDYGEDVFASECQQDPPERVKITADLLSADQIAAKQHSLKRGKVPLEVTTLTSHVDIQKGVAYWTVIGWSDEFTGYVIDYGVFPKQTRKYFTLSSIRKTCQKLWPTLSIEALIKKMVKAIVTELDEREFPREDGAVMHIAQGLVDAGWHTKEVKAAVRQLGRANWMPALGIGVKASAPYPLVNPHVKRKPGEARGEPGAQWKIPPVTGDTRHVVFDTNYWKTFLHGRWATDIDEVGSLSLFKANNHRMFGDHQRAEYPTELEGPRGKVDEWNEMPGRPDNHFFDNCVGCCVAASMQKVSLGGGQSRQSRSTGKRLSLAEMRERKR